MAFENLNESDDIEKLCEEIDAHQKEYDRKLLEEDSKFQQEKTKAISRIKGGSMDKRELGYGYQFMTTDNNNIGS